LHKDLRRARLNEYRSAAANLIGATYDDIAFASNASIGLNYFSLLVGKEGSILSAVDEHAAVLLPWIAKSMKVDLAQKENGRLSLECYARCLRKDTKVIAVSHVRHRDGVVNDLAGLAAMAKSVNALLVVDATQSAGVENIDVNLGIHALVFSGRKWLNAGHGTGLVYINPDVLRERGLPIAGKRAQLSKSDPLFGFTPRLKASSLELGATPVPAAFALGAAVKEIQLKGIEAIEADVRSLNKALLSGLADLINSDRIRLFEGSSNHIVGLQTEKAINLEARLLTERIIVSRFENILRVSLSWRNNVTEIEKFIEIVTTLLR